MRHRALPILFVGLLCATLIACGGGGGGGSSGGGVGYAPPPPAPTPTPVPTQTPVPGNGSPLPSVSAPDNLWSPSDVANALQFPVQSGYNGTGIGVAIIIDAYPATTDIQDYLSFFQIPSTSRTIEYENVDGGPSGTDTNGPSEATLDTETIAALAPGSNITVYGVPSLTYQDFDDALDQIISDHKVNVVSYSASGCESDGVSTVDTVLQQAAANAITVVAAAGDEGNECNDDGSYQVGVGFPASDPNLIGTGGTETLAASYALTSNTVWNDDSCTNGQCAGGGGVSQYFSLPSYQQGLSGESSTSYRNVPDVSMPAEDDAEYFNGSWYIVWGTSWSAPQYAALTAEVYEYCNAAFTGPTGVPYYVNGEDAAAFIDVVNGNDQFDGTTPYYSAGPRYDDASGLGVPLGMPFAETICPNRVPALATRRGAEASRPATHEFTLNVTPSIHGLLDAGRRPPSTLTRIQIVILPTAGLAASEQIVINALRRSGFTIVQTFPNHLLVDAQAPSASVERLFSTQLHDIVQGRYGLRYMPVLPVTIPSSLAPYVAAINLDDVVTMQAPREMAP